MRSYPIYTKVERDKGRAPDAQFGASDEFEQRVLVGTSATNSHTLANIRVTRYPLEDGAQRFTLLIDGIRIKSGVVRDGNLTFDEQL